VTDKELPEHMRGVLPEFMALLGGKPAAYDPDTHACTFHYNIGRQCCHTVDIVQGGFVTSMLDATMSHTAFGAGEGITNVLTLEIKVSFLSPSRAGRFRAVGRILKASYKTAFLTGELYNEAGELTATATSTAKLVH
jgi:uncharacterized protein (TIGR00369 family)